MNEAAFSHIKENILSDLAEAPEILRGMFLKNWLRYKASVKYVVEAQPDSSTGSLLDYGCGHPFMTRMLSDLGYTIEGYEPFATENEWQTARGALGVDKQYLTQIPVGKTFDLILMIDVIEHLSIIKPVMEEIYKLNSTNGYLVISTPNVMRIEMWLQFIRRRTGHPQPLRNFLESTNNYSHHQREFTQDELRQTVKHFGYKVILSECKSTRDRRALNMYHSLLDKNPGSSSIPIKSYQWIVDSMYRWFPNSLANNLFLIGQKRQSF